MAAQATQVWTVGSLLTWTTDFFVRKGVDEGRLSAELLLAHVLKCSRMALYTQYERVPAEGERAAFKELVNQRAVHVPVAYLIGRAWFFSLEVEVDRHVLIPRADTETLVEYVLQQARGRAEWSGKGGVSGVPAILDLCCGSGVIGLALAKHLPTAVVTGVDVSGKAVAVARRNAELLGLSERVMILEGDLFGALEKEKGPAMFDVVAANPPYIPTGAIGELPVGIREHEPRLALDGGLDGMDFHRRIAAEAKRYLREGGLLIMEMQFDQGAGIEGILAAAGGYGHVRVVRDAAGHPRCVVGIRQ